MTDAIVIPDAPECEPWWVGDIETRTDPLLDLPVIDDDLWHRLPNLAEIENAVNGVPMITLCGFRFPDRPEGIVRRATATREHRPCLRCDAINTYVLRS